MIDLNTDSWARVVADKSKKNTQKWIMSVAPIVGPASHGCLFSLPGLSAFVRERGRGGEV